MWLPYYFHLYSFVHESARWLIGNGETARAVAILKSIAKTNGRKVGDQVFDSFKV